MDMSPLPAHLRWLEHNKGRSQATLTKYSGHLERLRAWLIGRGADLLGATYADLEQFTGIEAHKDGLSARARRPMVSAIRGFYAWAIAEGLIVDNPARRLPSPKAGSPLPIPLGLHNAEKIMLQPDLGTFIGLRDAAIMAVMLGTGLRISGVCAINESSLVWSYDDGQERLTIKALEKGGKERFVPVPHEARLLVRAYLGHEHLDEVDRSLPKHDRVLWINTINSNVPRHEHYGESRRITPRTINKIIVRYGLSAGIPRNQLHAHAFRHLYGTELVESGTDTLTVQTLMGHAHASSSAIYTHLAMRTLQRRVDEANPLGKINTPVTSLARQLKGR